MNKTVNMNQSPWWMNWFKTEPIIVNQIDHSLKIGDILLFRRNPDSKVAGLLARFLKKMYGFWDGWGWHMAYIYDIATDGSVIIAEAKIGHGVQLTKYVHPFLLGEIRIYRFTKRVDQSVIERYTQTRIGCSYDIWCYFWTALQLISNRLLGYSIPIINNNKYTCWELVCDMMRSTGKPLQPIEKYPVLPAMVEVLNCYGKRIY